LILKSNQDIGITYYILNETVSNNLIRGGGNAVTPTFSQDLNILKYNTYTNLTSVPLTVIFGVQSASAEGCITSLNKPITITIFPTPTLDVDLSLSACSDSSIGLILKTKSGFFPSLTYEVYNVKVDQGLQALPSNAPVPASLVSADYLKDDKYINNTSSPLTVEYTVFANSGCLSESGIVSVTINPHLDEISISGPELVCENQAGVVYNISPANSSSFYLWTADGSQISSEASGMGLTSITVDFSTLPSVLEVKETNAFGCNGPAAKFNTSVSGVVSIANQPSPICSGETTTLSAVGGSEYTWSPNIGLSVTTGSSVEASPLTSTTYQVTSEINGCLSSASVEVVVKPTPPKPIITISNLNTSSPLLTSSSSTGNQWYLNGSEIVSAINQNYTVEEPGTYIVRVNINNCLSEPSDPKNLIIVGVEELEEKLKAIEIYPNPVSKEVSIGLDKFEPKMNFKVMVFDQTGKQIKAFSSWGGSKINLDLSGYPSGLYLVRVTSNSESHSYRVIKE
jgi:hypothetical protein